MRRKTKKCEPELISLINLNRDFKNYINLTISQVCTVSLYFDNKQISFLNFIVT